MMNVEIIMMKLVVIKKKNVKRKKRVDVRINE
jgi:hypothetical protein